MTCSPAAEGIETLSPELHSRTVAACEAPAYNVYIYIYIYIDAHVYLSLSLSIYIYIYILLYDTILS